LHTNLIDVFLLETVNNITSLYVVNATHVAVVPADVNNDATGPALATACATLDDGLAAVLGATFADVSVSTALMGPAPDGKGGRTTWGCWKPLSKYNRNRQCCYPWAILCSNCRPAGYTSELIYFKHRSCPDHPVSSPVLTIRRCAEWKCCCWP
jgi:hypothetical protein